MPAAALPRLPLRLGVAALLALAVRAQAAAPAAPTPSRVVEELPVVRGALDLPALPIKRAKSSIGSLLFVQTPAGSVGEFATISGLATPLAPGAAGELAYPTFMGPLTMKALDTLMRGVQALHGGWPRGQHITLSFSARPVPADLVPANLPSALMLDSMIRDFDIDPGYAVIGLLQPDGSIEAVGAIAGRLSGAGRARVSRLAVPEKNAREVADFLLSGGIGAFVGTQVFTVKHYNEAGVLALTKLDPHTAEVVALFGTVQRTLSGVNVARAADMLRTAGTQEVLQRVIAAAPNHLSAQVLLDWGTGKRTQVSLGGSMEAIDRYGPTVLRAFRASNNELKSVPKPAVAQEMAALRVMRERVDPAMRPWADAILRFGDALQRAQASSSKATLAALDAARETGNAKWVKAVQLKQNVPAEKP